MTNEEKANELANDNCTHICLADCSAESYFGSENDCYNAALQMAEWKDEQLPEWLTAFAQHLNKRGAFRDDLCMDFEHEAQSFIEFREYQILQKRE